MSQYTDNTAAYTTFFSPYSFAATSTWSVPCTFVLFVATRSLIERGTDGITTCITGYVIQETGIGDAPLHEMVVRILTQVRDILRISRKTGLSTLTTNWP